MSSRTILVLVVILLTAVAYIGLSVYWEIDEVHLEPKVQAHMKSINGSLDTELMGEIVGKESQYLVVEGSDLE